MVESRWLMAKKLRPFFIFPSTINHQPPPMHLLFDLDGTLIDSRSGIITCIQHALGKLELPVPPAAELLWCVGPPLLESLSKLVSPERHDQFEPLVEIYRQQYSETGIYDCSVYPGMIDTLTELSSLGHSLYVATSKAEIYARRIIDHFDLAPFFLSVNGSELDGTRANKAELIAHILQLHQIPPNDAAMIGDREHDMIGASKCGIPAIGVLWGYGTGAELMNSRARACVRIPSLLPESLAAVR